MPRIRARAVDSAEAELIGAALRYAAVSDWFENLPPTTPQDEVMHAASAFKTAEHELRAAARALARKHGAQDEVFALIRTEFIRGIMRCR